MAVLAYTSWCQFENVRELHNARRENWTIPNPTADVVLMCKDDDRYNVIVDLVQFRRPYPFNADTFLGTPFKPLLHVLSASQTVDKARYTAYGTTEQVIDYTYDSFINVSYGILPGILYCSDKLELDSQPNYNIGLLYSTETFEPQTDFITFDYRNFFWKFPQLDCDAPVTGAQWDRGSEGGFRLNKLTLNKTVEGYWSIPPGALAWEGKTNDQAYVSDITGHIYEKNTLLVQDVKVRRGAYNYDQPQGKPTFAIDATLVWRETGWNTFPKLDDTGVEAKITFEQVCVQLKDGVAKKPFEPFPEVDLSDFLFFGFPGYPGASTYFKEGSIFTPLATNNVCD